MWSCHLQKSSASHSPFDIKIGECLPELLKIYARDFYILQLRGVYDVCPLFYQAAVRIYAREPGRLIVFCVKARTKLESIVQGLQISLLFFFFLGLVSSSAASSIKLLVIACASTCACAYVVRA